MNLLKDTLPRSSKDLAIQMIKVNRLTIRNKDKFSSDIEITKSSLRPSEKIYEELLIDAKSKNINHPLIHKANEGFVVKELLWGKLYQLNISLYGQNYENSLKILVEFILGLE